MEIEGFSEVSARIQGGLIFLFLLALIASGLKVHLDFEGALRILGPTASVQVQPFVRGLEILPPGPGERATCNMSCLHNFRGTLLAIWGLCFGPISVRPHELYGRNRPKPEPENCKSCPAKVLSAGHVPWNLVPVAFDLTGPMDKRSSTSDRGGQTA